MKKIILLVTVFCLFVLGGIFWYRNLRGIKPVFSSPSQDISDLLPSTSSSSVSLRPGKNNTSFPLQLPNNFDISILAKNISGARVLVRDSRGNLWVSRPKEGKVTLLDLENGQLKAQADVVTNLNHPHGLAFAPNDPNHLYIAQEDKIIRIEVYRDAEAFAGKPDIDVVKGVLLTSNIGQEKIVALPMGGRHTTRSLLFDAEGNLFVSIGSSCDVCREQNMHRATIMRVNLSEKKLEPFAKGLRNSVFMILHPVQGNIWATEMGRDFLGDNLPPDEINIFDPQDTDNKNYGWPNCYGKNIHDEKFDTNVYIRNPCMEPFEVPSYIDLPAHSASLGLTFIPAHSKWPSEYWNNLLVAYHGSWNRSEPTGYKIVRYPLNEKGEALATSFQEENFISGWLTQKNQSLGRPVDLLATADGILYVSDDKAGVIYQVEYHEK